MRTWRVFAEPVTILALIATDTNSVIELAPQALADTVDIT